MAFNLLTSTLSSNTNTSKELKRAHDSESNLPIKYDDRTQLGFSWLVMFSVLKTKY